MSGCLVRQAAALHLTGSAQLRVRFARRARAPPAWDRAHCHAPCHARAQFGAYCWIRAASRSPATTPPPWRRGCWRCAAAGAMQPAGTALAWRRQRGSRRRWPCCALSASSHWVGARGKGALRPGWAGLWHISHHIRRRTHARTHARRRLCLSRPCKLFLCAEGGCRGLPACASWRHWPALAGRRPAWTHKTHTHAHTHAAAVSYNNRGPLEGRLAPIGSLLEKLCKLELENDCGPGGARRPALMQQCCVAAAPAGLWNADRAGWNANACAGHAVCSLDTCMPFCKPALMHSPFPHLPLYLQP